MKRKERGDKEKQTSTSSSQKTFFLKKVRCKKDDTFVKMSGYLLYAANKDAGVKAIGTGESGCNLLCLICGDLKIFKKNRRDVKIY